MQITRNRRLGLTTKKKKIKTKGKILKKDCDNDPNLRPSPGPRVRVLLTRKCSFARELASRVTEKLFYRAVRFDMFSGLTNRKKHMSFLSRHKIFTVIMLSVERIYGFRSLYFQYSHL